jgi:hypothetical protein
MIGPGQPMLTHTTSVRIRVIYINIHDCIYALELFALTMQQCHGHGWASCWRRAATLEPHVPPDPIDELLRLLVDVFSLLLRRATTAHLRRSKRGGAGTAATAASLLSSRRDSAVHGRPRDKVADHLDPVHLLHRHQLPAAAGRRSSRALASLAPEKRHLLLPRTLPKLSVACSWKPVASPFI